MSESRILNRRSFNYSSHNERKSKVAIGIAIFPEFQLNTREQPAREKIARLVTRFPGRRLSRFRTYFIARFLVYLLRGEPSRR